ncbi:hypothetical protein XU18_3420 [Perkinsela sp. CCAP 1560/4]|nr:hypothetical protein XU18_3420 [Perkinsela sp. CCAP 1560/4]|eukprot:KNH05449.1 hypothetical protein XU18_3420 [Perkinsela sp. CCAP 1560/4]
MERTDLEEAQYLPTDPIASVDTLEAPAKKCPPRKNRTPRSPQELPQLEKLSPGFLENFSLSHWLAHNHLSKYLEAFAAQNITSPGEIVSLPPSSYGKILGIRSLKDKKHLGGAILMLHEAITEHIQSGKECHTQPLSTQQRITSRIVSPQTARISLASLTSGSLDASQCSAFNGTQLTQKRQNRSKRRRDLYFTLTRLFDHPPRVNMERPDTDTVNGQPFWSRIYRSPSTASGSGRDPETAEWCFSTSSKYQHRRPPLWDIGTLLADTAERPDVFIDKPQSSIRREAVDAVDNLHDTTSRLIQDATQRMCEAVREVLLSFECEKQRIVETYAVKRSKLQRETRFRLTQADTEAIFPEVAWPGSCDVSVRIASQRGRSAWKSRDTQTISRDRVDSVAMCNVLLNVMDLPPETMRRENVGILDDVELENRKLVKTIAPVENWVSQLAEGRQCTQNSNIHSPEGPPAPHHSYTTDDAVSNQPLDDTQPMPGKSDDIPVLDTSIHWNASPEAINGIEANDSYFVPSPVAQRFDMSPCGSDGRLENERPVSSLEFELGDFAGTGLMDGLVIGHTGKVPYEENSAGNCVELDALEGVASMDGVCTPEAQISGGLEIGPSNETTSQVVSPNKKLLSTDFDDFCPHRLSGSPVAGVFHGGCSDEKQLPNIGRIPNIHESPRGPSLVDPPHPLSPFNKWSKAALKCECRKNGLKIGAEREMRRRLNLLWKRSAARAFTATAEAGGKATQDDRLPLSQHAPEWLSQNASQSSQKTTRERGKNSDSVKVSAAQLMRAATFVLRTASASCASSLSVMERLLLLEAVTVVEVQIALRRLAENEYVKASADRTASAVNHTDEFLLIYRSCLKKLKHCTVSFVKNWLRFSGITVKAPTA